LTVKLKIADANAVRSEGSVTPEELQGVKVLIVDDNRTNRRILEGMLKGWQMRAASVDSGEEALTELLLARDTEDPYALILTDVHMPTMDGFTLGERIRQISGLAAATIMMLTSGGHRDDAARCQELGIAVYLLKPVRQSELREAIGRVRGTATWEIPLITRFSLNDSGTAMTPLRILLAEDNAVNQRLLTLLLEKRRHQVIVAGNGREALAAMEKGTFDLVLMDVQMPEMDGLEATAAIRAGEAHGSEHQMVIALTAHAMKGDRERCVAAGMDSYLGKPIRPQELDAMLEGISKRRRGVENVQYSAGVRKN
jgi:two-component system, sensor histidine kinase and response regulator